MLTFLIIYGMELSENVGVLCKGRTSTDGGVDLQLEKRIHMFLGVAETICLSYLHLARRVLNFSETLSSKGVHISYFLPSIAEWDQIVLEIDKKNKVLAIEQKLKGRAKKGESLQDRWNLKERSTNGWFED